jgi:glycosyltransferase involved in cell wall biosynthesis
LLKISYLSGPADFKSTYNEYVGAREASFFGTDYPAQFIELCMRLDARAQIVTWRGEQAFDEQFGARFDVLNRPLPTSRGLRFHLDMLVWNLRILLSMLRFRPDVLVLTGCQDFWWLYAPLRLTGTRLVPSFHCVQWPIFRPVSRRKRFYAALNSLAVLRSSPAIVVTSKAIRGQVEVMLGRSRVPIHEHLPTYSPVQFEHLVETRPAAYDPFSILFVGRIEENKGVFDLLDVAARLERSHPGRFRYHFCGTGTALDELAKRVRDGGLSHIVTIHGFCEPAVLSGVIAQCHCYVVPTRSDFEAGYEMTCAEAILAHRPVITSAVAPAIDDVRAAAIEVAPDDRDAYLEAILRLADDPVFYQAKVEACRAIAERYYDPANSWLEAMVRSVAAPKNKLSVK